MKAFFIALSIVTVTLGSARAQTDPNAPTGPFNPNPPAQIVGQQTPIACAPPANGTSNAAGATAPSGSAAQAPGAQTGKQANAAKDQPAAGAGCAGQDHPGGGSTPSPANPPRP